MDIDPQVFAAGQVDCKLDQGTPTTSYCSGSDLAVGGSPGSEKRSVLRFDVAGVVPYGARVTHAALGMKVQGQTTSQAKLVNIHRLTTTFVSTATWNSPWTSPGGDFGGAVDCENCSTVGGTTGVQPGSTAYWAIRKLVDSWANATITNNGLLAKTDTVTSGGNVITLASSEVPGNGPFIDIRYEQRLGMLPAHKYESQQLSDRMSLAVNSGTGNLLVRSSDVTVPGGLGPDMTVGRSYNSKQALTPSSRSAPAGWGRLRRSPPAS